MELCAVILGRLYRKAGNLEKTEAIISSTPHNYELHIARAHDCDGAAESSDLRPDGESERAVIDQDIQAVPASEAKALLGQSFLVKRVLRRHGWSGCGDDPEIREIPGEEGTVRGTAKPGDLGKPVMAQLQAAPIGGRHLAPYGGMI